MLGWGCWGGEVERGLDKRVVEQPAYCQPAVGGLTRCLCPLTFWPAVFPQLLDFLCRGLAAMLTLWVVALGDPVQRLDTLLLYVWGKRDGEGVQSPYAILRSPWAGSRAEEAGKAVTVSSCHPRKGHTGVTVAIGACKLSHTGVFLSMLAVSCPLSPQRPFYARLGLSGCSLLAREFCVWPSKATDPSLSERCSSGRKQKALS